MFFEVFTTSFQKIIKKHMVLISALFAIYRYNFYYLTNKIYTINFKYLNYKSRVINISVTAITRIKAVLCLRKWLRQELNCVPCVLKTCSGANVPYMLTCSRTSVYFVLTCAHGNMSCVLTCSRPSLPCLFTSSRPNMLCVLTCSRGKVLCVLSRSRASVSHVSACLAYHVSEWLVISLTHVQTCLQCLASYGLCDHVITC